ncbi:MAG: divalent-cation tolerance protein CutA [Candidatus Nealsonbacteria bacterium]
MIFVYVTFPDKKTAQKIGEGLIRKKLAACLNIMPIDSIYEWRGKIKKKREVASFIKTTSAKFKPVEKYILKNHPYATPCILEIKLGRIARGYLKWLKQGLK